MEQNPLGAAVATALVNPLDPNASYQVHRAREVMKRELDRLKLLVDSGRFGCIIVTELLDDSGKQVRSTPYGDPSLVLQTAAHIVERAARQTSEQAHGQGDHQRVPAHGQ